MLIEGWVSNESPGKLAGKDWSEIRKYNLAEGFEMFEGEPQATSHYSMEQLREMGRIGIYRRLLPPVVTDKKVKKGKL
jgi:hypothetical protein